MNKISSLPRSNYKKEPNSGAEEFCEWDEESSREHQLHGRPDGEKEKMTWRTGILK